MYINITITLGATALGEPWPPQQSASIVSIHCFILMAFRSATTSSIHLKGGLPFLLPTNSLPSIIFLGIASSSILFTYVHQHSDEMLIISGLHVSAVKEPKSGQCRTYTRYNTECTLILHRVYVLHWPDDGCFTAETCSPDVIDISSLC